MLLHILWDPGCFVRTLDLTGINLFGNFPAGGSGRGREGKRKKNIVADRCCSTGSRIRISMNKKLFSDPGNFGAEKKIWLSSSSLFPLSLFLHILHLIGQKRKLRVCLLLSLFSIPPPCIQISFRNSSFKPRPHFHSAPQRMWERTEQWMRHFPAKSRVTYPAVCQH